MNTRVKAFSLDVTSRCNLRCAHCYNESGGAGADDLTSEELIKIAGEMTAFSPEGVCLCGGEPLLSEGLFEVMDVLREKQVQISMVTNGLLVTPVKAAALKAHGLTAIQISLDGAFSWQHDSLRGSAGAFNKGVAAIRNLKEAGIDQVCVALIPNRLNYRTIDVFFQLCVSLGVTLLRFMPFMPVGRGYIEGKNLILNAQEMLYFQIQLAALKEQYRTLLSVEWDDPVGSARHLCRRLQGDQSPLILCVAPNGDVRTDVYAPVKVGNLRKQTFQEVIETGSREAKEQGRFQKILDSLHNINDLRFVRC